MAFHFGEIKIRAGPLLDQSAGIVEKRKSEIEQGSGYGLTVHQHVFFRKMPATRSHHKRRGFWLQLILFSFGAYKGKRAIDGIPQIDLALYVVGPSGGVGVFEIGHKYVGARIQRIDHHFPFHRARDLDLAFRQIRRNRRHLPIGLAYGFGSREKIKKLAVVDFFLTGFTCFQQSGPRWLKFSCEFGHKLNCLRRKDFGKLRRDGARNFHTPDAGKRNRWTI